MRTPEEIAREIEIEATSSPSFPIFEARESLIIHGLIVKAAREAQAAPSFKPEGVRDAYRDGWAKIVDLTNPESGTDPWSFSIGIGGPEGFFGYVFITREKARHILAYLSEQSSAE